MTPARVTQIMRLLDLAPDIQDQILDATSCRTERQLLSLACVHDWTQQTADLISREDIPMDPGRVVAPKHRGGQARPCSHDEEHRLLCVELAPLNLDSFSE